jgi:putative tricarboxylic transport membrane protein
MGVALMTTLTITLEPNQALLILICTYVGAIYGGSRSAILLNIPGTPASAASCLDGHALAKKGEAGRAMGIATSGSVVGTWIGMLCLAFFTPVLGEMALKFGAYEFFWLATFGVAASGKTHSMRTTVSPSASTIFPAASRSCPRLSVLSVSPKC